MLRRTPILLRMVLAVYVIAISTSVLVGWIGVSVAQTEVQKRLVVGMAENCAALLEQLNLRPSAGVLNRLTQIAGGQLIVTPKGSLAFSASTLADTAAADVRRQLSGDPMRNGVVLDGKMHLVGSSEFIRRRPIGEEQRLQVYLLVPKDTIVAAEREATRKIVRLSILVVIGATFITVLLSMSITLPLRRLAGQLDQLSQDASDSSGPNRQLTFSAPTTGPTEVVQLANSFDRLLKNLNDAQNRLARVERLAALGKVAASVVHELRNPLSGMKMHARLLQDGWEGDEDSRESLDVISREIERLDLYLQELVALTRGTKKGGSDSAGPVDLLAEAQHVVKLIDGKLQHLGITADCRAEGSPGPALADAHRVRQVVLNFALNACEAMPKGGKVQLITKSGDQDSVRFEIHDQGSGVDAEDDKDVFDAFVSTKFDGGGLGLYICRQIIQDHDGRIGFENTKDGAMFWFELPRAKES